MGFTRPRSVFIYPPARSIKTQHYYFSFSFFLSFFNFDTWVQRESGGLTAASRRSNLIVPRVHGPLSAAACVIAFVTYFGRSSLRFFKPGLYCIVDGRSRSPVPRGVFILCGQRITICHIRMWKTFWSIVETEGRPFNCMDLEFP